MQEVRFSKFFLEKIAQRKARQPFPCYLLPVCRPSEHARYSCQLLLCTQVFRRGFEAFPQKIFCLLHGTPPSPQFAKAQCSARTIGGYAHRFLVCVDRVILSFHPLVRDSKIIGNLPIGSISVMSGRKVRYRFFKTL